MSIFRVSAFSLRSLSSALAALAFLGLLIGLSGCKGPKGDPGPAASVTTQQPTGTIEGLIIDAVTKQPIVGAVVDIGVATATTNTDGQFVFRNIVVPVDANNNTFAAQYFATVNLRSVTSPVNMGSTTATPRYPDFHYDVIPITFTQLYTSASGVTTATPVTGLIANVTFTPGKLAATITGTVADSVTKQPVAAGYTVNLVSPAPGSNNSATGTGGSGGTENVVDSTTTGAGGTFTFANVESLKSFRIDAWNTAQTSRGSVAVTAPADGETKILSVQGNNTVLVASTDVLAPTIISVTPENNADIAASVANQNVVFTFSEPIQQNAYAKALSASAIPTGGTGLYNDITVSYLGAKAGNITHTLSWNATFDQLTVNIPGLAGSSKYSVVIAATNKLVDNSNNALVLAAGIGSGTLNFTTNGSATPAAPTITLVNAAGLDFTGIPVLDWLPISGAKAYNVYRTATIGGISGPPVLLTPQALVSNFTEAAALPFTSNQNKVTYDYVVKSVGADNQESAASNLVSAQDAVLPTIIAQAAAGSTVTLTFSEPMDEVSAETIGNYALTRAIAPAAPTLSTAVYNVATNQVVLTFAAALTIDANNSLTVTTVKDVSGNSNSTVGANNVRTF
jgi:hypothetical protein